MKAEKRAGGGTITDVVLFTRGRRDSVSTSHADYRYKVAARDFGLDGYARTHDEAVSMKKRFERENPGREGTWTVKNNPDFKNDSAAKLDEAAERSWTA